MRALITIFCLPITMLYTQQAGFVESQDVIVDSIVQRQTAQENKIIDMQFHAHSVFREMDSKGKVKEEILIERIVYEKGEKQTTHYLSMSSNGKNLNDKQMVKEIADWEKQGKKRGTTKMPFNQRFRDEYEYSLNGWSTYHGDDVRVIGFTPKHDGDGYIKGFAFIDPIDCCVLRIEAKPAQLPGVIKDMLMIYTYNKEQGYCLPEAFEFSMRLKVQFVLTFVHNTYTLEDRYSQFLLNSDLPDSLFAETR